MKYLALVSSFATVFVMGSVMAAVIHSHLPAERKKPVSISLKEK